MKTTDQTQVIQETISVLIKSGKKKEVKEYINSLTVNTQFEIKRGLSTYTVYKVSQAKIQVDSTSNGWITTTISVDKLVNLLTNKISVLDLEWN